MNQERAAQLAEKRVLEIDEQVCNQTQNHVIFIWVYTFFTFIWVYTFKTKYGKLLATQT